MADIQKTVELACRFREMNQKSYSACYRNAAEVIDLYDRMAEDNAFDVTSKMCNMAPTDDSWSRLFRAHVNFGIGKLGYEALRGIVQEEFFGSASVS